MLKFIFKTKKAKYTCACCGYKTLFSNEMGEICPVCHWEEDYDDGSDPFHFSGANHLTLYQAQENYKMFGCFNRKMIKHARNPHDDEKKDPGWRSIQYNIENKYDCSQLIDEINRCCKDLKTSDSEKIYKNFKSLHEIDIVRDDYRECEPDKLKCELKLKSLLVALCNRDIQESINLLDKYYQSGLYYYISWSIMLFVLTSVKQIKSDEKITNILLDVENNNYYGLSSLETALKEYWMAMY